MLFWRKKYRKSLPLWQDQGLIFTTDTGNPIDLRWLQRLFDGACEQAEIPRHQLKETRHTFATLGLVNREPVKIISEVLGHASVSIALDIYSHVIAGLQEHSLSYLDRLWL